MEIIKFPEPPKVPKKPVPPECRILYESIFHYRIFDTRAEFDEWQKLSWWRKFKSKVDTRTK